MRRLKSFGGLSRALLALLLIVMLAVGLVTPCAGDEDSAEQVFNDDISDPVVQ